MSNAICTLESNAVRSGKNYLRAVQLLDQLHRATNVVFVFKDFEESKRFISILLNLIDQSFLSINVEKIILMIKSFGSYKIDCFDCSLTITNDVKKSALSDSNKQTEDNIVESVS